MLYVPEYYFHFSCLKDACRHTCCAGWEIDIDEESLARFRAMPGALGEKLRANIDEDEEGAHFRLTADERCPMLNADGLCELLLHNGGDTDVLCDVCDNHPEFHNFSFAGREEYGLGLCCEAAAKLILGWEHPVKLVSCGEEEETEAEDPQDAELLVLRETLFDIAQDRSMPVAERTDRMLRVFGVTAGDLEVRRWLPALLELERLDKAWTEALSGIAEEALPADPGADFETPLEQLLVYLIFRHLSGGIEDGMVRERGLLCVLLTNLVRMLLGAQLSRTGAVSREDMAELCRMLSSEIEYSDENMDVLLDLISQRCK